MLTDVSSLVNKDFQITRGPISLMPQTYT